MNPIWRTQQSIDVQVRLFADLRRFLPDGHDGPLSYRLRAGATVDELLTVIGIAQDAEITAGVNGELGQRRTVLSNGDQLVLFSPMEGGARETPNPQKERFL